MCTIDYANALYIYFVLISDMKVWKMHKKEHGCVNHEDENVFHGGFSNSEKLAKSLNVYSIFYQASFLLWSCFFIRVSGVCKCCKVSV